MKNQQRGAISLEMIIVIALLIVLFGWAVSRSDMMQSRAGTLTSASNIVTLGQNVRSLLKDSTGYGASGTDLVPALITNNGVPKNITIAGGTALVNDYGGPITIVSTGSGFIATDTSLPPDICIQDAMKVSKSGTYTSISINGGAATGGEITSAMAGASCTLAGQSNSISYTSAS
jgi:type II secretory pathway pseudopilin PulG